VNWAKRRAQRAAELRARLDSDLGLPPAKSPPTVAQVARVGAPLPERAPRPRPVPPPAVMPMPAEFAPPPDRPLPHICADEASIRATLYRPCPPGMPLELWLDMLAEQD
jgi:hypothetical protein